MAYGNGIFMPFNDGTNVPSNYTVSKGQLPLFLYRHDLISGRENWWLRDIVSAVYFALVISVGVATYSGASNAIGVRPYFCIAGN